jgi:hypothetical protein
MNVRFGASIRVCVPGSFGYRPFSAVLIQCNWEFISGSRVTVSWVTVMVAWLQVKVKGFKVD